MADGRFPYVRLALTAGVLTVGVAAGLLSQGNRARLRGTDFDRDIRAMDGEIAALSAEAAASPANADPSVRLAYRLYQRSALTGRPGDVAAVRTILDERLQRVESAPSWRLLQATLDLRAHRLDAAESALASAPELAGNPDAQTLEADIAWQRGQYERARRGYEAALGQAPAWTILARLAFVTARSGDADAADRLYVRAEDEVTAKEMRAYAWLELQRGQLQFSRGRYDDARARYESAARAYSGYWMVDEYMAELLGATKQFGDAASLYRRAIARAPRPDLLQQLGDLYVFMGKPAEAKRWHQQALDGYLESIQRGEVQFVHHLAGYYADVAMDAGEAVRWARDDAVRRPHYATEDMLAWALYRNGRTAEALEVSTRAVASGIVDAHLYYHAATINTAGGRVDAGRELTAALHRLNPRYSDFHVHR